MEKPQTLLPSMGLVLG